MKTGRPQCVLISNGTQQNTQKGGRPMRKITYLAMDLHARNFTLGEMDGKGRFIGNREFRTSEKNIIQALKTVNAK